MTVRAATPLKVRDRVRVGAGGRAVWAVARIDVYGRWVLTSETSGRVRYIGAIQLPYLRRVNGRPIACLNRVPLGTPRPLQVDDLVRFRPCRGRDASKTIWTVVRIGDPGVTLKSRAGAHRHLDWRDIENERIVRASGRPIRIGESAWPSSHIGEST
jgi:hypothetical protein